jgi:hypothetical protein
VLLAPSVPRGAVTRDDTAAVLVALLDTPATAGSTLELVEGDEEVHASVAAAAAVSPGRRPDDPDAGPEPGDPTASTRTAPADTAASGPEEGPG